MPFLRVVRDKRGYETTYLMHVYRDGTRQLTRVLYVFRTPGGVRVGREPLERAIQQQVEAGNPDIEFDWSAVFETRQVIDSSVEPRRARRRSPEEGSQEPRPPVPQLAQPAPLPAIPPIIEGSTPDDRVAFLVRWYAVAREHIDRMTDPSRKEALTILAQRLDPSGWTDVDQITAGLQTAGEALERLSHILTRRKRRGKKRPAVPAEQREAPSDETTPDA